MKVKEFEEYKEEDGKIVIQVLEHKTTGSFEPANVVVEPNIFDIMNEYYTTIRKTIPPQSTEFAERFISLIQDMNLKTETMQDVASQFDIKLPSATLHRKWIDSVPILMWMIKLCIY